MFGFDWSKSRILPSDQFNADGCFIETYFSSSTRPSCRKQLCPSLVALMGNPVNDKTITSHHGYMGALERDRLSDRLGLGLGNHDFNV